MSAFVKCSRTPAVARRLRQAMSAGVREGSEEETAEVSHGGVDVDS